MKPWMFILIGVLLISGTAFVVFKFTKESRDNYWTAKIETANKEAIEKAITKERAQQEIVNAAYEKQLKDSRTINASLRHDIDKLQQRPTRGSLSDAEKAQCKGSNGAELAREYARFLVEYAALAAEKDSALEACYTYADSLQE